MFSLKGKRVLITGASSGFGAHFAKLLANAGASIICLCARRTDRLAQLKTEIEEVHSSVSICYVRMDVSSVDSIRAGFNEAERLAGNQVFDVIINNAGVGDKGLVLDIGPKVYNKVMDVNVRGYYFVAQEAALRLIKQKITGNIVNVGSIYGMRVGVNLGMYAISKAAVVQMTKAMGLELMRHGIRVNCILPGFFPTEMVDDFFSSKLGKAFIKRIPSKRLGKLEELDGPMLLLCSDASRYMNGSLLTVDGGHLLSSL